MELKVRLEGAHRSCTPEQTIGRMRPHFDAAGITRLAEITGLDRIGIPVAQCVRPDGLILSVDSGKGATREAALCSAMMEGFERHVGESFPVPSLLSSGRDLKTSEHRLPLWRGAVYLPDIVRSWTPVTGLATGTMSHVPSEMVSLIPRQPTSPILASCFSSTSNGLSSGNTLQEAVAGGIYEVIERDQVTCAVECSTPVPRVNLDSVCNEVLGSLVERLRGHGILPILCDCTGDLGVPTFIAYLCDHERGTGIYRGYAAHLDPVVAQCRAITEAVQARLVWIAGSRDDITHEAYSNFKRSDTLETVTRLMAAERVVPSNLHPDSSTATFDGDIAVLLSKLSDARIPEPLVHEFSHPYPCSVVRVLIPTLEGYMNKFTAPGARASRA